MDKKSIQNDEFSSRFSQIKAHFFANSNRQFAKMIDVEETTLSSICSGKKKPGNIILQKVCESCPGLSRAWLYFGEGDMLICDPTPERTANSQSGNGNQVVGSIRGNNTYNAAQPSLSEQLIQQYEARIREKDERISELKERIEDQRKYISILSDEHKSLVHQAIGMLSDNNTRIMDIQEKADEIQQIGYRFTSQLDNTTNESERYK